MASKDGHLERGKGWEGSRDVKPGEGEGKSKLPGYTGSHDLEKRK